MLCLQVWFEVSAHTGRVHFHSTENGTAPLGLSMPMGMLQGSTLTASLQDLLHALDTRYICLLLAFTSLFTQARSLKHFLQSNCNIPHVVHQASKSLIANILYLR